MDRRKFVLQSAGVVAGAGLVGAFLGSCGGGDDGGMTGPDGEDGMEDDTFDGTILLTGSLLFEPEEVTIQAGETITWENDADIAHTITPDGHSEWARQVLNSAGETFQHTFNSPGTFEYFCEFHPPGMVGTINVVQHQ